MRDRVSLYPGRVKLTPVEGQENVFDLVRADNPTQVGTALSKANLLKDTTAVQFGLDSSAVPNDILNWLGKYNEYWWSLLHGEAYSYTKYVESKADITADVWMRYAYTDQEMQYSKSIEIDQSTGTISLENPSTYTIEGTKKWANAETFMNEIVALTPCYVTNLHDNPTKIYYLPEGTTYAASGNTSTGTFVYDNDEDYGYNYSLNDGKNASPKAQLVTSEAQIIQVPAGETTYEHSTDRNAYPDSGKVDGITYTYLGCPFEKFPTAPQIETGSYTGTGTYGSSNPNSLTFIRKPLIVFIIDENGKSSDLNSRYLGVCGYNSSMKNLCISTVETSYTTWADDGKTVTWYHKEGNAYQLNISGNKYNYIALG